MSSQNTTNNRQQDVTFEDNKVSTRQTNQDLVLDPDGTGAVSVKNTYTLATSDGTAGQPLVAQGDGTTAFQTLEEPMVGSVNVVEFTSSGTYEPPDNLLFAKVELVGGGGGSCGAQSTSSNEYAIGASGGGGGYAASYLSASTIGSSQTVTVGSGGSAGDDSGEQSGGSGGSSSFGSLVEASGGSFGEAGNLSTGTSNSFPGNIASGGSGVTGQIKVRGGYSNPGTRINNSKRNMIPTAGGSFFGVSGAAIRVGSSSGGASGVAGEAPGVGGAAPSNAGSQIGRAGVVGADGIVYITEFLAGTAGPGADLVRGPATSTDNAIATWNGSSGDELRDTDLTINGSEINSATDLGLNPSGDLKLKNAYTMPAADGSAGQFLSTDGSGNISFTSAAPGSGATQINVKTFDASGTYNKPNDLLFAEVRVIGAGGGGGGVASTSGLGDRKQSSAGGGGGGASYRALLSGDLSASESVTVGSGGSGGSAGNNDGSSGGSSSFGALLSASGGGGGKGSGGNGNKINAGGNAGSGSGGTFNVDGSDGSNGIVGVADQPNKREIVTASGAGGGAYGGGSRRAPRNSGGRSGHSSGGGGSGVMNTSDQSSRGGGNGGNGKVIVIEYLAS